MIEVIVFLICLFACVILAHFLVGSDEKNNTNKIADNVKIEEVKEPEPIKEQDISSPVREIAELFKARPQDFVVTYSNSSYCQFEHVSLPIEGNVARVGVRERIEVNIHKVNLTDCEKELLKRTYIDYISEFNKQKELRNRAIITKAIKGVKS